MSNVDDTRGKHFEALLRPHLDRLYRLAFRLAGTKADAEDLFQDVLTKIYPRTEELVDIEERGAWMCRVLYNHFIDNRRRYARQRMVIVPEHALRDQSIDSHADRFDVAADAEQTDNIMRLQAALEQLSEEHRLVVMLHDCEGYKLTEIQDLTSVPIGTLKSRLHRARARLREILGNDGTLSGV